MAVISCDKGHIFVPSQKVRPLGLYYLYYPEGIFFCDRTNLTPSDKKLFSRDKADIYCR